SSTHLPTKGTQHSVACRPGHCDATRKAVHPDAVALSLRNTFGGAQVLMVHPIHLPDPATNRPSQRHRVACERASNNSLAGCQANVHLRFVRSAKGVRSEEHTSELQSRRDL